MQDFAIPKEEMETLLNIEDEEVVEEVKVKKTKENEDFDPELYEDYEIQISIKDDLYDVFHYGKSRTDKLKSRIEQCSRSFYIPPENSKSLWLGYAWKYSVYSTLQKLVGKTLRVKIRLHNEDDTQSEIIVNNDFVVQSISAYFWQQNPKQHSMIYLSMQKKNK